MLDSVDAKRPDSQTLRIFIFLSRFPSVLQTLRMALKATMRALDEVAARLPFHVDDVEKANEAFLRWRETGDPHALRTVELWTYCYTRRYFIVKFLRDSAYGPTELDTLVGKAFTRAHSNFDQVKQPERFASWVSVICKNTFLNFVRRYREQFALDEARVVGDAPPPHGEHDRLLIRRAVEQAIDRLPPSLQEVARRRFLEGQPYDAMSDATGRPVPSLRAYVNKAVVRLREDPALRALLHEIEP